MTLPRLVQLRKFWNKHPRVEWLKAMELGVKPTGGKTGFKNMPKKGIDELISKFGLSPGSKVSQ